MDGSHHINEHRSSLNVTTSIYNQLGSVDLLLHLGGLSFARGYSSVVSETTPNTKKKLFHEGYVYSSVNSETTANNQPTTIQPMINDTSNKGQKNKPLHKGHTLKSQKFTCLFYQYILTSEGTITIYL